MKNFLKILFLIVFAQKSFTQKINANLVSKNAELNLSLEPKMRGVKNADVLYYLANNLQTLSAYKNGKLKWQTNVVSVCGKPSVGKSQIRIVKPQKEKLFVVFGKHSFAEIDVKNGKAKCTGSD